MDSSALLTELPRLRRYARALVGDRAPVLFWTLAGARQSANLPTTPVALDAIDFVSNVETNYEIALQRHVDQRQSQAFALEAAAAAPAFEHPELQAFVDGGSASYLTRVRGSLLPAALQNNVATVTLRPASAERSGAGHGARGRVVAAQRDLGGRRTLTQPTAGRIRRAQPLNAATPQAARRPGSAPHRPPSGPSPPLRPRRQPSRRRRRPR